MNDPLRSGLEAGADLYDIPPGDLDQVRGRARRRDRRRRRLTGSVAVLGLLAGTFTAVRLADNEPGVDTSTTGFAAQLGDSGIAWERVADPDAGLGGFWQSPGVVEAGGGVYALSTAPGERGDNTGEITRMIWRTENGVDWAPSSSPESFWVSDLSGSDGRLYAIGTGPATTSTTGRKVHDVRIGRSDTADGVWTQQSLPLDLTPIADATTSLYFPSMDVAASGDDVVAVVSTQAELDVRELLDVEAPNGWTITPDGINVLGDGECPPDSSGADPAGKPTAPEAERAERAADGDEAADGGAPSTTVPADGADADAAGEDRPRRMFHSYCGNGEQTAEEVHGVASRHTWDEAGVTGDLLDAVLGRPFAFHSSDGGATFERVALPSIGAQLFGGSTHVEPDADGFTVVRSWREDLQGMQTVEVLRSTDGRTWQGQHDAIPGLHHVTSIGTVDGRLAVVGQGDVDSLYAELHPDGWQVTSFTSLLGIQVPEDRGVYAEAAAMGPLGVVVSVGVPDGDGVDYRLLASRDGRTWSNDSLTEAAGEDNLRGVSQIVMRGDRVAVSIRLDTGDLEHTDRIAVVGTPR